MNLELHIWGSDIDHPSIDPECLGAITYLSHALTPADIPWSLVHSNDASVSPANILPALNHDGRWTSGFEAIVNYLAVTGLGDDLDGRLSAEQRADSIAYYAFLKSQAAPLLDLYLYASAANWAAFTRPTYSKLLPFPLTWTLPPLIRASALERVKHLDMAELDNDFDPNAGLHITASRDALPETFRRYLPAQSKRTILEEMTPEQAVAIKLYSLSEDCLGVLNDLLLATRGEGTKQSFFEGGSCTSLDCLAYGYLALMRDAPVPRSFLKDWMLEKAPGLSDLIDQMKPQPIGNSVCGPQELTSQANKTSLGYRIVDSTVRHVPGFGDYYTNQMRTRAEQGLKGFDRNMFTLISSLLSIGVALGYGVHLFRAMPPLGAARHVWRAQMQGSRLKSQFGQLGSMLDSIVGSSSTGGYPPDTGSFPSSPIINSGIELD